MLEKLLRGASHQVKATAAYQVSCAACALFRGLTTLLSRPCTSLPAPHSGRPTKTRPASRCRC